MIWDENGERQKVLGYSRGKPRYKPTTRKKRIKEAVEGRIFRHKFMHAMWPIMVGSIGGDYIAMSAHNRPVSLVFLLVISGCLCLFVPVFIYDLLYQFGWQLMKGHKVLDEAVPVSLPPSDPYPPSSPWADLGGSGER